MRPVPAVALAGLLLPHAVALAQLPAARLAWLFPAGASPGSTNVVAVAGTDLDDPTALLFSDPRVTGTPVPGNPSAFRVVVPEGVAPGTLDARLAGRFGVSPPLGFVVDPLPAAVMPATNMSPATAAPVDRAHQWHTRVVANATHWFRFDARKGERIVATADTARIDSRLVPDLAVFDPAGAEVARTRRLGRVDFTATADGSYRLQLSDSLYRGGDDYGVALTVGTGPVVDFAMPCVLRAGATNRVTLFGRNLPGGRPSALTGVDGVALQSAEADVAAPAGADPAAWPAEALSRPAHAGTRAWAWRWNTTNGPSNPVLFVLSTNGVPAAQFPAGTAASALAEVTPPVDFSGVFPRGNAPSGVVFQARKGDVFVVETVAERLGQTVDPHAVVQRATGAGQWTDVAEAGDLDTNSGGTEFNTVSRDGAVRVQFPEDGRYRILVRDLLHTSPSAPHRPYVLSIRRPAPAFALAAWPTPPPKANGEDRNVHPAGLVLRRGQTVGVRVAALRRDGFDGDIALAATGLPSGVAAAPASVPAGQGSGWILLTADDTAPATAAEVHLTGTAAALAGSTPVEARWGAVKWHVPDSNNEPVANRLVRRTVLGVVAEPAPLTVFPADNSPAAAAAGSKLSVAFRATRHSDSQAAFSLRAAGHPALEKAPEVKFAEKATNAVLELDLAALKLPEGTHTLWLQGQAVVKYRNQPEAVERADAALRQAEKDLAAAPADRKAAAEQAKKAAEAAKKSAEERAKPRDVTLNVWSRPFTVRVDPAPKK